MNTHTVKGWLESMEKVLLLVCGVGVFLDGIANVFMLWNYPMWQKTKNKEIRELREQNKELKEFIKELVKDEETV